MNRSMGNRNPVEMFQGGSLDDMVEALRRAGVIPSKGQGENGEQPVVLVAPALEIIDETLLEAQGQLTGGVVSFTYPMRSLVDVRLALRLLFLVRSSLNQAVTMQVIGNEGNQPGGQGINIGSTTSMAANGSRAGFAVNLDDAPYPWIGMTAATGGTAPTTGSLSVRAYGLKWVLPKGGAR